MTSTNNPFASKPSPGAPVITTGEHERFGPVPPPNGASLRKRGRRSMEGLTRTNESTVAEPQKTTPDQRRSAPKRILGSWELHELLAQGPLTSVYSARPAGCPQGRPADYIVKLVRADMTDEPVAIAGLRREAEVGRSCSHHNLVPVLEAQLDEQAPFIVMPRIDGASLDRVVAAVRGLVVAQALWITRQVAQALSHLHHQGWLHGDVKPANILVSRAGHATLIDLAFAMNPQESFYSSERPLQASLAYVAPELLTSTCSTHPVSDIYSLGITLYELLAGRLPFATNDSSRLVESHLRESPPTFSAERRIPENVEQLVRLMLAKDPLRRPQSAAELVDLLTNLEIDTLESRFQV